MGPVDLNFQAILGNWFDLVLLAWLVFGAVRGLMRGMSLELLGLLEALAAVAICGYLHKPLGLWFTDFAGVTREFAYVFVYLCLLALIVSGFGWVKNSTGGKIVSSDLFGRAERLLGMFAGMLRYAAVALIFLAVMNVQSYTKADVDAAESGKPPGKLPSLVKLHFQITRESYLADAARKHLGIILIEPQTPPPKTVIKVRLPNFLHGNSRTNAVPSKNK